MKSHISATIDETVLKKMDKYSHAVKRSRSQIIEIAVDRLLRAEAPEADGVVTSSGTFEGAFSREETYAR